MKPHKSFVFLAINNTKIYENNLYNSLYVYNLLVFNPIKTYNYIKLHILFCRWQYHLYRGIFGTLFLFPFQPSTAHFWKFLRSSEPNWTHQIFSKYINLYLLSYLARKDEVSASIPSDLNTVFDLKKQHLCRRISKLIVSRPLRACRSAWCENGWKCRIEI